MGDEPGGGRGYEAGVLRRAVALLVSRFPPEARERASAELMRAVEELHTREGVAFGGAAAAPRDLLLDELRERASATSWRKLAREVELSPRALQMLVERHTQRPRESTERRLRDWASRRIAQDT